MVYLQAFQFHFGGRLEKNKFLLSLSNFCTFLRQKWCFAALDMSQICTSLCVFDILLCIMLTMIFNSDILNVNSLPNMPGLVRVAGVGWLSGTAADSLRAFVERVVDHFCAKNLAFYD